MLTEEEIIEADNFLSSLAKRPSEESIQKAAYWTCSRKGLNPDAKIEGSDDTMLEDAIRLIKNHWTKHEAVELAQSFFGEGKQS